MRLFASSFAEPFVLSARRTENGWEGDMTFDPDASYFQGHFPGQPIMPGVLQIEAIAQACALMCLSAKTEDATGGAASYDTILTGVENARFRRMIVPGDQIRIETTLVHHKGRFGKATGRIVVEDKVATEATLSFMLIPHKAE